MSDAPALILDPSLVQRLQAALGDGYVVDGLLGRGGFGLVFAARDLRLQREVAIKLLRPELAAPILRERFRREAESAAGLRHPGIVPIFAIGEAGDLSWFVMPRIIGETLRARLEREGRLPVGEVRRILTDTARALGAAHAAGLIHRDIKPDNILLEGEERRVVLTDFGIAKSLTASDSSGALTTSGLVVGSPDYMSPEQAGGGGTVDARSDLYALGVVGYQLLSGALPFGSEGPGGVLLRQLKGPAPAVQTLRPECPAAIAQAVDRCLLLEPADRWPSTDAFIQALERSSFQVPHPVAAGATDRANAVRGYRRLLLAAAIMVLLAIVVDAVRAAPLFSPMVLLVSLGVLAARYGTLWTRGLGWRDLLTPEPPAGRSAAAMPARHSAVLQARSDRASVLRLLQEWPRGERLRLTGLVPAIDEAVARVEELGGELDRTVQLISRLPAGPQRERGERRASDLRDLIQEAAAPLARLTMLVRELGQSGPGDRGAEVEALLAQLATGGKRQAG